MGVAALGVCHADRATAAAYVCAHQYPSVPVVNGSSVYQLTCQSALSDRLNLTAYSYSGGTTSYAAVSPLFQGPSCSEAFSSDPFNLSLTEGALVASAVLAVWGIAACWRELAAFINQGGNSNEDLK